VSSDIVKNFLRMGSQPKEGGVTVISSADNRAKAEFGVLAAAWTLLD